MEDAEAPTVGETEPSFEQKSSLKINQKESNYILNFGIYGESIYFELYDLKIQNYKYMDIFNLDSLKKINCFFNQFQNTDKMIKVINNFMNSDKFRINDEKNESKAIYFSNPLDEEDIISIELKMKEKNQKEIVKDLSNTLTELKAKNTDLENKITTMNNLLIEIQKKYDEKILKLEESFQSLSQKLEEEKSIIQDGQKKKMFNYLKNGFLPIKKFL